MNRAEDLESLKAMARTNHRDTRFYYDGHFSVEAADRLYETWIERSCTGYADVVLVAERDGQPAGYITCDLHGDYGQIGLLGVGEVWQGQGIGRLLSTVRSVGSANVAASGYRWSRRDVTCTRSVPISAAVSSHHSFNSGIIDGSTQG